MCFTDTKMIALVFLMKIKESVIECEKILNSIHLNIAFTTEMHRVLNRAGLFGSGSGSGRVQIFFHFLLHEFFSIESIQFLVADFKSAISIFLHALVLMQSSFYYSYLGGILYISFVHFLPIASH